MRLVLVMVMCGMVAGCVEDGPAALQSPDVHDLSATGNFGSGIGSQVRTLGALPETTSIPPSPAIPNPPSSKVICLSPGYSVAPTGC